MEEYISKSKAWVQDFIIKHSFCPFAKEPFDRGRIGWEVLQLKQQFGKGLLDRVQKFLNEHAELDTIFLIIPELSDFDTFLEVFYFLEESILEIDLAEEIKLVAFHPQSKFEGVAEDAKIQNLNRSPYPMIQFLRHGDIAKLGLSEDDVQRILDRNAEYIEEIEIDIA